MAETIHLPGLGNVKRGYVIAGGIGVIGVSYVIYRRQQQANAVAASGANTGIDPATGYAYGSPEDAAALANQGVYVNPGTGIGSIGGSTGYVPPGQTGSTVPQAFRSNAEWTQYVIAFMQGNDMVTSDAPLGSALGKYITGVVPTSDEINLIQQAVSIAGYPPISGADGYPPAIRTGTTTPPPSGGGGTTTPPPSGGGGTTTPPPSTDWTTHTTLTEGGHLDTLLATFGMTQAEFEAHNPGVTQYYHWYIPGKGYQSGPGNGAIVAFNVAGKTVYVLVKRGGW